MSMNVWLRCFRLLAAVALVALAAGCSKDKRADRLLCPSARVMGEPSELTRFRDGPGRGPADIVFEAAFAQVTGKCSYDADGGEITLQLTVLFDILRGQASPDGKASFSYFVAVATRPREPGQLPVVQARQAFGIGTRFTRSRKSMRYTDELEIKIPRPDARSPRNYVLYLGFELTPAELAYNKRKLGF